MTRIFNRDNEHFGFKRNGEFLNDLSKYQLLMKDT